MATAWSDDIKHRLATLTALGATFRVKPDADNYLAHDGRYVLLHFDLVTIKKSGATVDRLAI